MRNNFIARQPIFNKNKQVFGYELLFRSSAHSQNDNIFDNDRATLQVLEDSLLGTGITRLTNRKIAFINFPTNILLAPFILNLPKDILIIEILETVLPSTDIIIQCKKLKMAGFSLALDDFSTLSVNTELLPFVDYVKVDFRVTNRHERREFIKKYKQYNIVFLAEKVETYDEFKEAIHDGYSLFQGYFFSKPEVLITKAVNLISKTTFQFMRELMMEEPNFNKLESILSHDVSLSYKILRFINSSYFGFSRKITSIRQALMLLGKDGLYKWSSLFILSSYIKNKPSELLVLSLVRARFAELIAEQLQQENPNEFFLAGMFSLLDAFFDCPLDVILENLPIHDEVKQGIKFSNNIIGKVMSLVAACEKADWNKCAQLSEKLHIPYPILLNKYNQAQQWSYVDSIVLNI
ncbi:EAL and HDOD domain-containing protein [Pectinatus brassicae]|uniref:EAL and modified HD-GYP domain-containing signal transduction protein n=1 Tax=Pectinatus brassicae TaxID=862415 RepID=A0A840UDC2_9FIRM|nr:HDOD domain-containing protein [Pectinatus brassicae]MBB5335731.1 EAL and modified HD-GYP domain-containing signal transduction protein [Pectinatus brassicae]